jgi:hypothetical protein
MAKFIELTVTSGTAYIAGKKLLGVEGISTAVASAANTIKVFYGTTSHVAITTTTSKSKEVLDLINAAITANPGGVKAKVLLPSGVEITAITQA